MPISFVDFLTMLIRRHQTFVEMYEVSAQEVALLERGQKTEFDPELLSLQQKRLDLMSEVDSINEWIADSGETIWEESEQSEIDGLIRKTLTVAAAIARNDEAAHAILKENYQELKQKMTEVNSGRKARDAYGQGLTPDVASDPFFFDRTR